MKVKRLGGAILFVALVSALGASRLAPHAADEKFPGLLNAPPTTLHFRADAGTWRSPFIYPWRLVSRLEHEWQDRTAEPRLLAELDELAKRWRALEVGESLTLEWPRPERRKRHPPRDRRRPTPARQR